MLTAVTTCKELGCLKRAYCIIIIHKNHYVLYIKQHKQLSEPVSTFLSSSTAENKFVMFYEDILCLLNRLTYCTIGVLCQRQSTKLILT